MATFLLASASRSGQAVSRSLYRYRRLRCRCQTTTTALYCIGEGWTGAMGTGRLDQDVAGHFDLTSDDVEMPVKMFETPHHVISVGAGWGHTAFVVQESDDDPLPTEEEAAPLAIRKTKVATNDTLRNTQLYITGRPHEFSKLLRLKRLPAWLRKYAVDRTYVTTHAPINPWSFHPVDLIARIITFLAELMKDKTQDWETARAYSFVISPMMVELPHWESPLQVDCSAGLTAVTCTHSVYTFGLNAIGQCGVGSSSNNVWKPQAVTGLSSEFAPGERAELYQHYPARHVALGLQHGLCLNDVGEMFAWGKNENGQVGSDASDIEIHTAVPIWKAFQPRSLKDKSQPTYRALGKIAQVSAGMIHSAALEEETNNVFVWGKFTIPSEMDSRKVAADAKLPVQVHGLPKHVKVLKIACGSHHTAMLLEDGSVWAVGVSTDTKKPIHDPVCLIEAGVVEFPIVQFDAHMDRTTIITDSQVLQVHLWEKENLRQSAVFTPAWVDEIYKNDPDLRIREIHRSWLHTVIVTEKG